VSVRHLLERWTIAQPPALSTPSARRRMWVLPAPSGRCVWGGARLGTYAIIDIESENILIFLLLAWRLCAGFTFHSGEGYGRQG